VYRVRDRDLVLPNVVKCLKSRRIVTVHVNFTVKCLYDGDSKNRGRQVCHDCPMQRVNCDVMKLILANDEALTFLLLRLAKRLDEIFLLALYFPDELWS